MKIIRGIHRLRKLLAVFHIHPAQFVIPALLGLGASMFEGLSIGLLIPTIKGVIGADFGFVRDFPGIHAVTSVFPVDVRSRNSLLFCLLVSLIFASAVAKNVLQYASTLSTISQVENFANNLRKGIYGRYLAFGKLFFDQNNAGQLHQLLIGNTAVVSGQLRTLQGCMFLLFTLIVYFGLMLAISWKLTAFVIFALPILHYGFKWLIFKIEKTSESFADSYSEMGKKISNALACLPLVQLYTNAATEKDRFEKISDRVKQLQYSLDKKQQLIAPLQELVILVMFLLIVSGMAFLLHGGYGEIASYLVFFLILKKSMNAIGVFNIIQSSFASVKGLALQIVSIYSDDDKYFIPDGRLEFPGLSDRIDFTGLNFEYPNGFQALRNVSFSIKRGSMTAIVGSSGAGKTTLANLLLRFYDSPAGAIRIDEIDIREYTLKSLRNRMALVSQDALLFNDSIRFNLTYGLSGAVTEESLIRAIRHSRLDGLVKQLPRGLDTEIGDRGVRLSGGEKQRLAIARAVLKKAEILILDEATSSLDAVTERQIQEALEELVVSRTTIVIAHRLATIQKADKIIVLEGGQVAEEGSLDELLSKKGCFAEYWAAQKFD